MGRPEWWERLKILLMLLPALLVLVGLFSGGLVVGLGQSLGYLPAAGLHSVTLQHYVDLLVEDAFWQSLWVTFSLAFTSTLLSTLVAVPCAFLLRDTFRGSRLVNFLFQVPIPIPHLVVAFGVVTLVAQSGMLARLLASLGWLSEPSQFPALVFDRAGVAIQLVYLWKEIPFIGLVVLAVLQNVGPDYEALAQTLGATRWQRFRHVLLPLILPAILSTSMIVFAFVFASYEIPLLLGVRFPAPLPVWSIQLYRDPDLSLRPGAMAIGVLLTLFSILWLVAYRRLMRYALRAAGGR